MSQILGLGLHDKGNIGHLGTVWGLVILINATPLVLYLKKKQNQRGRGDKTRTSRLTNPVGCLYRSFLAHNTVYRWEVNLLQ